MLNYQDHPQFSNQGPRQPQNLIQDRRHPQFSNQINDASALKTILI